MNGYHNNPRSSNSTTNDTTTTSLHLFQQKKKKITDIRRPYRILIFTTFFLFTSFRRLHITTHFEFMASLPDDDVSIANESNGVEERSISSNSDISTLAKGSNLIIFYNLYIPHDTEGIANAVSVVKDQIGQIASALKSMEDDENSSATKEKRGVVLYNLIGNYAFTSQQMVDQCHMLHPRLDCHLIRHYENASESVTLNNLHDFCSKDEHQSHRVVYLHSKGSYHNNKFQRHWREELTTSSLHLNCLHAPEQCDVCGAQFYTRFALMFPGNMWTAKCSYIQKLLPPVEGGEYEKRKEESIKQFLKLRMEGLFQNTLTHDQLDFYGLGRYQWEHWIGSHPSINPCDIHNNEVNFEDMVKDKVPPGYYQQAMAPHRDDWCTFGSDRTKDFIRDDNEGDQFREYYYLSGNIIKWSALYGLVPEQHSWVWDHFPAGNKWKDLVKQNGTNTILEVQHSNTKFHSAFDSIKDHKTSSFPLSKDVVQLVVLYHISFPSDDESKELALSAIKAQFQILFQSFYQKQKVMLYYLISGGNQQDSDYISSLCQQYMDRITCHQLSGHVSEKAVGGTFVHLHRFCNTHPSFNTVYLTNQLPGFEPSENERRFNVTTIRAITSAVLSENCLPSESCNVCGAHFHPLPYFHFEGNMFSASCGYIQNLLPPRVFERDINNFAGDALLIHLYMGYNSELYELTPRTLGLHQHSIEHWIGSHPDLKPCSEAATLNDWLPLTPRRAITFQRYYHIACSIFRVHRMYNNVPGSNSWVWHFFPEGQLWTNESIGSILSSWKGLNSNAPHLGLAKDMTRANLNLPCFPCWDLQSHEPL